MRILSFTDQLGIGGSQVNAIELAAELQNAHGCEVLLFGNSGPMSELTREKGLSFRAAPQPGFLPSPVRMRALREIVRDIRPDLIHVWDWWQCLDAFYGVHVPMRIPMIVTVMEMTIPRLLPKRVTTTFGTPELVAQAKAQGRTPTALLLPPIDVNLNAPGAVDAHAFLAQHSLNDDAINIVTVSRLAAHLKGQSLRRTIDAMRQIGRSLPINLIIVGDGPERPILERRAMEINKELGALRIRLIGPMLDPRPAYAAADIVIGMGGSALRAMAFGKPVIIVGENGFSSCFTPETAESFYYKGLWGVGDGDPDNTMLVENIRTLVARPEHRPVLGDFGRQFVVRHFSIKTVATQFANLCHVTVGRRPLLHVSAMDALRTAGIYMRERRFTWRWIPEPIPTAHPRA